MVILTLSASTGWSYGSLICNNDKGETLKIVENPSPIADKFPPKGPAFKKVELTLAIFRTSQYFQGQVWAGAYSMLPTEDGQDVTLEVVPVTTFALKCGRCPGNDFPPIPIGPTHYAKLSVGNHIYDFSCHSYVP